MIYDKYDIKYVAVYLRKSRGEEEDLAKHELILTDMCKQNNWQFALYKEIGTSDSLEMRPEMKKLLNDIELQFYDAVLVVDYDRLSRGDMGQQNIIKTILKKTNTLIITPKMVFDLSNENDELHTDFMGMFARQEYKIITKRLKQGKVTGSKMGNWTNGKPPFGYAYERYKNKYNEKRLVVNDEELVVYRTIVEKALTGISCTTIAKELNEKGILTSKGNKWSYVTIYRLLTNEVYLGKIISNKQKGDGHKIKKQSSEKYRKLPREEWIIVENCHEAIISQEEFDKIQSLLEERKKVPLVSRACKSEFSGILKCGICGYSVALQYKNDGWYIKTCQHVDKQGNACSNKGGHIKPLTDAIWKIIRSHKNELINNIRTSEDRESVIIRQNLLNKKQELQKCNRALSIIKDSYELGDYTREEFLERKEKWDCKLTKFSGEIEFLENRLKNIESNTVENKKKNLELILNNPSILDNTSKNLLYKTIIEKITWLNNGVNKKFEIKLR